MICGLLFFHAVIENSYKSWFPIFCIMLHYLNKEKAAFLVSLVMVIIIAERCLNFNMIKAVDYFSVLNIFLFCSAIMAYFTGFTSYLIFATPIFFAILNAPQYALYYTLPTYFNFQVKSKEGAKFIMAYAMGETILVTLTGFMMDFIHPISLHFFMLTLCIVSRIGYVEAKKILSKSKDEN